MENVAINYYGLKLIIPRSQYENNEEYKKCEVIGSGEIQIECIDPVPKLWGESIINPLLPLQDKTNKPIRI